MRAKARQNRRLRDCHVIKWHSVFGMEFVHLIGLTKTKVDASG